MSRLSSEVYLHIPPEGQFALGYNAGKKGNKQHETDMPNANPNTNVTHHDHIPPLVILVCVGLLGVHVGLLGIRVGSARLFDTNLLV